MLRRRRAGRNANLLRFRASTPDRRSGGPRASAVILHCMACGAAAIELRGPVGDDKVVRCAACGAEAGYWPEFLWRLERFIAQWRRALAADGSHPGWGRRK